jgi:5'-3' exonuclease
LLRESAEFNDPSLAEAEFATLSIWNLLNEVPLPISQYMALCILCFGNDFMPNIGIFSLRENGYDRALHMYSQCGCPDLRTPAGVHKFIQFAANKEIATLKERINLRKRPEEKAILGKDDSLISHKYGLHILDGVTDMKPVVASFWRTYWWTLDYFANSSPITWDWYYPYADAPLLMDIVKYKDQTLLEENHPNYTVTSQLQFIMPTTSLRTAKRRVKYTNELHSETRNPWLKRHDWEMKPRISLPWHPTWKLTTVAPL